MTKTVQALYDHDERLLGAVQAGTEIGRLPELMRIRAERIQALSAAMAGGATLSPGDIQLLQQRERELHASLRRRRDEVARELSALHHARRAEKTYQPAQMADPRFVDRAG